MSTLLVAACAAFFLGMGLVALARPELIYETFGVEGSGSLARSEVRSVYGGFGVAVAAVLVWALSTGGGVARGLLLAIGVATAGMALGRAWSALVDRPHGFYPNYLYLLVEIAIAIVLLAAA